MHKIAALSIRVPLGAVTKVVTVALAMSTAVQTVLRVATMSPSVVLRNHALKGVAMNMATVV